MRGYIFGGEGMPKTPQELEQKRAIAQALAMQVAGRPPKDVGEGLTSIGQALAFRRMMGAADKGAAAGQESANAAFAPILAALGGGGAFPARPESPAAGGAPVGTVERQPMDYASQRVSQAFGDNDIKSGIVQTASALGIDPVDLATAISYETAGTFDPTKRGPTTQWGQHRGLIQFGEPQAKKYGVDWSNPVGSQLGPDGAVAKYLRDTGVKPGMGMLDIYSAINAGGVGRYNASDANNGGAPGTVADKVNSQMAEHRQKAMALLGAQGGAPVQMAQAGGVAPEGERPEMAGNSDMPGMGALVGALSNPWLNQNQSSIVEALLGQRMKEMDPMTALERRKMELELKALESPQGDPFTLSEGQIRFDAQGNPIARGGEKAPDLPSAVREYEYARQQGFPGTFQDWEASKKGGMSLQVDPATGAVTFQQGANIKPLTEAQSKDTVYATRAEGALPLIDRFGEALTSLPETMAGQVPGVGNYMKSPEYQQAEQAGKEFLQAILRKDTGAAITAQETAEYGTVYLPRPGDSPEVLAQKRVSRQRALEAIKAGMPAQAILNQEKALQNVGTPAQPERQQKPVSEMTDEELEAIINGQ